MKAREEKEARRKDGPCCSTEADKKATNLRLLKKLQATVCDRVWNNELSRWEGIMPRRFVRENAVHMSHFRDFARKHGYRSR